MSQMITTASRNVNFMSQNVSKISFKKIGRKNKVK